jgi:hypothetical protein
MSNAVLCSAPVEVLYRRVRHEAEDGLTLVQVMEIELCCHHVNESPCPEHSCGFSVAEHVMVV